MNPHESCDDEALPIHEHFAKALYRVRRRVKSFAKPVVCQLRAGQSP